MSVFGVNLHQVVRGAIPLLHPDEHVLLIQSTGQENVRGIVSPTYADAVSVIAQIQSMGNDDLRAMNDTWRVEHQRKCYLFSETPAGIIPQTIVRTLERGGDLLRRADGSWWLITGMMEDFSNAGWVSVRIVEQLTVPAEAQAKADAYDNPTPEPGPQLTPGPEPSEPADDDGGDA